ncbi:FxsB family cyclophane-forming radical SAM/SPASM peptide maturase [Streptomyces jumonjinensis]
MPAATRPFRQFVIKVHSRCDLACDHCYVYRHADQSWRGRPVTMSPGTFRLAAARMAEHAAAHGLSRIHVVLHGGEPLLAGRERLRGFARELRAALAGVCELDLRMQTNGLRLDDAFCAMLAEEGIVTGVSLDGDRHANDRHRIRADGSGSHDQVVRAVRRLGSPAHRSAFGGLLCTVDVANDPVAVYRSLSGLDPPGIDFLLPHATWDRPPPRPHGPTEYADWLIAVHRSWTAEGRPVRIRLFESITRLTHGGISLTEALGTGSSDLLVVETDGAVEQADWLKTVAEGAPGTGFHVARDRFDQAAEHPGILAQRQGLDGLSAECRACPVVAVCGGGLYAHRYRTPSPTRPDGFDHPSVYCADLLKLIRYVEAADAGSTAHGLTPAHFDALASGFGGAAAVTELARTQRGVRRILLAAAHRSAMQGAAADQAATQGTAVHRSAAQGTAAEDQAAAQGPAEHQAVTRIPEADRSVPQGAPVPPAADRTTAARTPRERRTRDPLERQTAPGAATARDQGWRAVLGLSPAALETALADPGLRRWALAVCESGADDPGRPAEIALAATARTAGTLALTVPLRRGAVQLPGLGRLVTGPRAPAPVIAVEDGRITADGRPLDALPGQVRWQPLRHLEADGIRVALEDTDPYRGPGPTGPAPRLSGREHAGWQRAFRDAWAIVRDRHPRHAEGLAAGLTSLVPLPAPPGPAVAESSRHAFGALALSPPPTAEAFAVLLVEHFQRMKLAALEDLYDLLAPGGGRHRVAWRPDPQPLDAVLAGAYTRLALAGGSRARARAVLDALDVLEESGAATATGGRLLRAMRAGALTPAGPE